ncbi:MAG: hypothetical protein QXN08_04995 [Nitrososphaerales archaeon]
MASILISDNIKYYYNISYMRHDCMPMIYISEKTKDLLDKIVEALRKNTNTPARILKTDAIHAAVEEYAKKLGVKE